MKEYKLNWRFWFYTALVIFITVACPSMIKAGFANEILYENGEPDRQISLFLALAFTFIFIVYIMSLFTIIRIIAVNKLKALELTDDGIKDTFVVLQFLALIVILPVKFIPWEAVTYFDKKDEFPYVRLNTKLIQAGFIAKITLRFTGYDFLVSLVKPKVTIDEINTYKNRFNLDN